MRISNTKFILGISTFFTLSIMIMLFIATLPPAKFKSGTNINIAMNSSLSNIASQLYKEDIISSIFLFKTLITISGNKKGVSAGEYYFEKPLNMISVVGRALRGDHGIEKIKVTIPEGTNVSDMAYIILTKIPNFNAPKFYLLAKDKEGYLFPDTYFFLPNTRPEDVIKEMSSNFSRKIETLKPDIEKSKMSLSEIITLASIIEEEAKNYEEKRMVSGILKNRLSIGYFLQVDPPFYYITGKTGIVTYDDLKIDSPYNTYKYKGLPKGPISNPGTESIAAAINPINTKYLFYLTGKDGTMHYALTYDGHLQNKNKYMK